MSQVESVRVQAYVSPECAARLAVRAKGEGRSVSAMVARILDEFLGGGPVVAAEVEAVIEGRVASIEADDRGAVGRTLDRQGEPSSKTASCPMIDPGPGIKCKVCGKVHTPKGAK